MTFDDAMRFKAIDAPTLSSDGKWLGYVERPDRGDPTAKIQALQNKQTYSIERGSRVQFTRDGRWAAVTVAPKFLVAEKAKPDNRPDNALCIVETATGKQTMFENVAKFTLSEDSRWVAVHFTKNRKEPKEPKTTTPKDSTAAKKPAASEAKKDKKPEPGTMLVLKRLSDGQEKLLPFVKEFAFDSSATAFTYAILDTANKGALLNIALNIALNSSLNRTSADTTATMSATLDTLTLGAFTSITWQKAGTKLAYLAARASTTGTTSPATLKLWDMSAGNAAGNSSAQVLVRDTDAPKTWMLPSKNTLAWSPDGKKLIFGYKALEYYDSTGTVDNTASDTAEANLYNPVAIAKAVEGDVWHWNDPFTNIHQKKLWEQLKDRTNTAVYDFEAKRATLIADRDMPSVEFNEQRTVALGRSDAPYRKEVTWAGTYNDGYIVNVGTGERTKFATKIDYALDLSPNGSYALFYDKKQWSLYDVRSKTTRNLTEKLSVGFWDDEDDHPAEPPPFGIAGWVADEKGDKGVILYDKFDLWQFDCATGAAQNLTSGEGRKNDYTLRVQRLDTTRTFFRDGDNLMLLGFHNHKKNNVIFAATVGKQGVKRLLDDTKRFPRIVKAQNASQIVFSQMSYSQYPDLWLTDSTFKAPKKLTDLQKQTEPFAWGAAELVEWHSTDGTPLQGVLIKPGNYEPGKRYPVVVYFYEISSDRLFDFQMPVVGSRPAFGLYASNGYAMFLPDVRYVNGLPGQSAMKCIMPGVQKIIDMGIADPQKIGLHGHSWGGYQTMYMITQTDLFAAAVAGAAVANMTSAYGGIRYGTGLARMFQYERSQSRIGSTLWERRDLYVDNSPLFFADRIKTPTLMMFGDDDDAVPWTQGIEMYLAMRRLGKDAIFLQYRKEPHHPRKYANRYDYAVKMKEYFDHYLKGAPAADWITSGVPYRGK